MVEGPHVKNLSCGDKYETCISFIYQRSSLQINSVLVRALPIG